MNNNAPIKFIQANSPDGGFLQSEEWRKFQAITGRKTYLVDEISIIEHVLPIVGKYFYIPRGDISQSAAGVIDLAKREKAGWIRVDAEYRDKNYEVIKAPHDMQPKEIFLIDITKSEEQLLSEMKPKTRYNIRLAEKKRVNVFETREENNFKKFLHLTKVTAKRDGITPHPKSYYRKMWEMISPEILKLYVAEYENKIITANLVVFYGNVATYLHGASDNEYRNVMAPYLLQWRQILDAKKVGCIKYDFGGVKTHDRGSKWEGITKFKLGFSPNTKPTEFVGSYDIIIDPKRYYLYRIIQKIKNFFQ